MIDKLPKQDWQYFIPAFVIVIVFVGTDIIFNLNKLELAYFSGGLLIEPYRVITSHLVHADFGHLLANIGGIIVARFFLNELKLKNNFLFLVLICFLIPLQTSLQWLLDIYLFENPMSFLIGFSGILYGVDAFILFSSIFGKRRFLGLETSLTINAKVKEATIVITGIGFLWSLLPGVSFSGHLTGFMAGSILFFL